MSAVELHVYGTEEICASCVGLPSSRETASWLEAALARKYGEQVVVHYIDFQQAETAAGQAWAERIVAEDLWYPIVVLDGELIAEGNPRLKGIYRVLEDQGVQLHVG
jgi:disulfide oxidoreductase YuzD